MQSSDWVPDFVALNFGRQGQMQIRLLSRALYAMDRRHKDFISDLRLFECCNTQHIAMPNYRSQNIADWQYVACRDAVMNIFNFRNEMLAANDLANKQPVIAPLLTRDLLKASHRKFDEYFPEYVGIRHAVGHSGELAKSIESFEENSFAGTYDQNGIQIPDTSNLMISNTISGITYICTFEGKVVHCEVSQTTANKLLEVKTIFYSAFRAVPRVLTLPEGQGQTDHQ